jgi:hypothetical protein
MIVVVNAINNSGLIESPLRNGDAYWGAEQRLATIIKAAGLALGYAIRCVIAAACSHPEIRPAKLQLKHIRAAAIVFMPSLYVPIAAGLSESTRYSRRFSRLSTGISANNFTAAMAPRTRPVVRPNVLAKASWIFASRPGIHI